MKSKTTAAWFALLLGLDLWYLKRTKLARLIRWTLIGSLALIGVAISTDNGAFGMPFAFVFWGNIIWGFWRGIQLFAMSQEDFDRLYNSEYLKKQKSSAPATPSSIASDLKQLTDLHAAGSITAAEFQKAKDALLKKAA